MSGLRVAVLISGGGTNLQAIIDAVESGTLDLSVELVVSSRKDAFGLKRAQTHDIPAEYVGIGNYPNPVMRDMVLLNLMVEHKIDLIVLAGYLSILSEELVNAFEKRIINIHPSLIPKYCGDGFYGERVHQAVIENGETESGATTHFVDEGVDTGEILFQTKVTVTTEDTAETLAKKVLVVEHELLIQTLKAIENGEFTIGLRRQKND